jgi:hypothetical protein
LVVVHAAEMKYGRFVHRTLTAWLCNWTKYDRRLVFVIQRSSRQ